MNVLKDDEESGNDEKEKSFVEPFRHCEKLLSNDNHI